MSWWRKCVDWVARRGGEGSGAERRDTVRYTINLDTSCRLLAMVQGESNPIRVRNISAGGISLVLPRELPPDTLLEIELLNRPQMFLCKLQVNITYRVEHPSGDWIMGGAFLRRLTDEELRMLLS